MKVKTIASFFTDDTVFGCGEILDVSEDFAQSLINANYAVLVEEEAPKKRIATKKKKEETK